MKNRKARSLPRHVITWHSFHTRTSVYKYTARVVNSGIMRVINICNVCQHLQMYEESSEMIEQ
jgi:hypothetical protein